MSVICRWWGLCICVFNLLPLLFLALSFMWSSCWADTLAVPCPVWASVWAMLGCTWQRRARHSQGFVSASLGWPQLGLGETVRAISSLLSFSLLLGQLSLSFFQQNNLISLLQRLRLTVFYLCLAVDWLGAAITGWVCYRNISLRMWMLKPKCKLQSGFRVCVVSCGSHQEFGWIRNNAMVI